MAVKIKSELALTNYRPVRYAHVNMAAGADYVLTADPWSYLHGYLLHEAEGKQMKARKKFERAIYYSDLAREFYKGAEVVELPTKATLLYYGMLNLAKAFLSVSGVELETIIEHHGVSLPPQRKEMKVILTTADSLSIFAEFSKALNKPLSQSDYVSLEEAFKNIPEVHSVYKATYPNESEKYLPINIEFKTDDNHKKLWTEIRYEKKKENLVEASKIFAGERKAYFKEPIREGDWMVLRSKKTRYPNDFSKLDQIYKKTLNEFSEFDVCSLLTPRGYFYYCDLSPNKYHHLSYTLLAMFYMGSAARYRPTETKEMLNGNMRQLATEVASLCPKQFLYQIASLITSRLCVVPYAVI